MKTTAIVIKQIPAAIFFTALASAGIVWQTRQEQAIRGRNEKSVYRYTAGTVGVFSGGQGANPSDPEQQHPEERAP